MRMRRLKVKTYPNFYFEKKYWKQGFKLVAGADEVGRGSFAGPVVAACVVYLPEISKPKFQLPNRIRINDSKKLTPKQRKEAEVWIKDNALSWGIGETSASLINRIGMGKATKIAFRRAIKATRSKLDFLLIDAFFIPYVRGLRRKNQKAIVNGDEKSFTIASASIIAKVYRDNLMIGLSEKYPNFGWERNKGYGTLEHRRAIKKYGPTRLHRKDFIKGLT